MGAALSEPETLHTKEQRDGLINNCTSAEYKSMLAHTNTDISWRRQRNQRQARRARRRPRQTRRTEELPLLLERCGSPPSQPGTKHHTSRTYFFFAAVCVRRGGGPSSHPRSYRRREHHIFAPCLGREPARASHSVSLSLTSVVDPPCPETGGVAVGAKKKFANLGHDDEKTQRT